MKNKILLTGPYRDGSGWSASCLDFIKCLDLAGYDVVIRPNKYNGNVVKVGPKIEELESKSTEGCNIFFQYNLPEMFYYDGRFDKNIGYFFHETDHNKQVVVESGFKKPVHVIPCSIPIEKFEKGYRKYKQIEEQKGGDFLFYFIGDFNHRKNIAATIIAFHLEFDYGEPVNLALKLSKGHTTIDNHNLSIEEYIVKIKNSFKLRGNYKKEIILPEDYITDEEICQIHNSCDVFVAPSYGEGWNNCVLDSIGFGKTPIVTNWSSYPDYVDNNCGWMLDYTLTPVTGMNTMSTSIYSTLDQWALVSIAHLRKCMREAYTNRELRNQKSLNGINKIYNYSYENVGNMIKAILPCERVNLQKILMN